MGPQIPEDAEVVPMLWVEDEELVVLVEQIPRVKAQDGEVGVRGHGPGDIPATSLPGQETYTAARTETAGVIQQPPHTCTLHMNAGNMAD